MAQHPWIHGQPDPNIPTAEDAGGQKYWGHGQPAQTLGSIAGQYRYVPLPTSVIFGISHSRVRTVVRAVTFGVTFGIAASTQFCPRTYQTQTVVEAASIITPSAIETQTVIEVATIGGTTGETFVAQEAIETLSAQSNAPLSVAQEVIEVLSSVRINAVPSVCIPVQFGIAAPTRYVSAGNAVEHPYTGSLLIQFGSSYSRIRTIVRTGQTTITFNSSSSYSPVLTRTYTGLTAIQFNPTSHTWVPQIHVPTALTHIQFDPTATTQRTLPNHYAWSGFTHLQFGSNSSYYLNITGTSETQTVVETATVSSEIAAEETQTVVETAGWHEVAALQSQLVVEVATRVVIEPCSAPPDPGSNLCGSPNVLMWVTWDAGDAVHRIFTETPLPDLEE